MANGNPARTGRSTARTLFLSDIHLGFRHARVRELNEFLQGVEAERIVLVGDIVDALSLARRAFWTAQHTQVVRTLLARQRAGARLIYIPGNHDASLAMLAQMLQGQFEVHREWVHRSARGERLLVLHGDQFDGVLPCPRWLTRLGDVLHDATVMVSHRVNNLRRVLGRAFGDRFRAFFLFSIVVTLLSVVSPAVRWAFFTPGSRKAFTPLLTASTPVRAVQPLAKTLRSSQKETAAVTGAGAGSGVMGTG